jgi:hypothetical protein
MINIKGKFARIVAKVTSGKIKASASDKVISTDVNYPEVSTKVSGESYKVILENEIKRKPDPRKFKFIPETAGLVDILAKHIAIQLKDTIQLTDNLIPLKYKSGTNPFDNTGITETLSKRVNRFITESSSLTDQALLTVNKRNLDTTSFVDSLRFSFSKSRMDPVSITETVTFVAAYFRTALESANLSEQVLKTIRKPTTDLTNFTETYRFNTTKGIVESPVLTDVLLRYTRKTIVEYVTTSDNFNYNKNTAGSGSVNEGAGLADVLNKYLRRGPFTELSSITDIALLNPKLIKSDLIGFVDLVLRNPNKGSTDFVNFSEILLYKPNKGTTDLTNFTDNLLFYSKKNYLESVGFVDNLSKYSKKTYSEISTTVDILAKQMSIPRTDNVGITDLAALKPNKNHQDGLSVSESYLVRPNKGPVTPVGFIDTLTRKMYVVFTDLVNATENVLTSGSGTKTYGQTDNTGFIDVLLKYSRTILSEISTIVEVVAKYLRIIKTESVNFSETYLFKPTKQNSDTANFTESVTKYARSLLSEVTTITETINKNPKTTYTDSIGMTDNLVRYAKAVRSESVGFVDNLAKTFKLSLFDSVNAIDNFNGTIPSTGQSYNRTDATGLVDQLTIYKQDYFLSDYTTPGYTGTITIV